MPALNLFVSGDIDGLVKIWNCKKELIREVKFVDPISSVSFLNSKGEVVVGHSGSISLLRAQNCIMPSMILKDADSDYIKF